MSHDHTNDHNLDLAPFHRSLNNDALATIFQLSRAGFFHTNVNHHKKMRKMVRKKMAVRFFADLNIPLTNDYPASRVDHFDLSLKS